MNADQIARFKSKIKKEIEFHHFNGNVARWSSFITCLQMFDEILDESKLPKGVIDETNYIKDEN